MTKILTVDVRRTGLRRGTGRYRRFRPQLELGYSQELLALVNELMGAGADEAKELVNSAIAAVDEKHRSLERFGLAGLDLTPTARYAATLRVLRDLLLQG